MGAQNMLTDFYEAFKQAPTYHVVLEAGLVIWLLWLLFRKSYNPQDLQKLTPKEIEELISDWNPDDLVSEVPANHRALNPRVVTGKVGKHVTLDGVRCLNLATHNYLGLVEDSRIEDAALKCLSKYGVGSCGPRGFYGTVDVHLDLEEKLAKFTHTEEACVYSYGFATIASAIPAYAKRTDIIFADEMVNFAIQKALDASRSTIYFFKHNDMRDLERFLEEQAVRDAKAPKKARATRRFLVAEGIYMNTGEMAPLPELVELRKKYKLRMFLDEGISFATLGDTGRGLTEHFNLPIDEVDLVCGSLEWSLASTGGFCVGSHFIVEHQRLSGLGYCFSASVPPLLAAASIAALDIIEGDPSMFSKLKQRCHWLHEELTSLAPTLTLQGHSDSPVKHLHLGRSTGDRELDEKSLEDIANHCAQHGLAITMPAYLPLSEKHLPAPSLRITTNVQLSLEEIKFAAATIKTACDACF